MNRRIWWIVGIVFVVIGLFGVGGFGSVVSQSPFFNVTGKVNASAVGVNGTQLKFPDLIVSQLDYRIISNGTNSSDVNVTFTVRNVGQAIAGESFTSYMICAGNGCGAVNPFYTPSLGIGMNWSGSVFQNDLSNGINYSIPVGVDSGRDIRESNENNNQRKLNILI